MQPSGHMPGFHIPGTLVPIGAVMAQQAQQRMFAEQAAQEDAKVQRQKRVRLLLLLG